MNVVEYSVTVGPNMSPDEASADLFPGCKVVWLSEDRNGRTSVTYHYLVAWDDPPAEFT